MSFLTTAIARAVADDCAYAVTDYPAYRGGGAVSIAFEALTYDRSTYKMTGVKTGTGGLTVAHADPIYAPDYEGVYREFAADQAVWAGGRVVENLLTYSEDFSNAAWPKGGTCTVEADGKTVNFPAEGDSIIQSNAKLGLDAGVTRISQLKLSGSGTITIRVVNGSGTDGTDAQVTLSATPIIFSVAHTSTSSASQAGLRLVRQVGDTATQVFCDFSMLEDATGRSDTTTPSEYIKTEATAVQKVYANANGNSVTDNVVTEGTGALLSPLPSLFYTPAATNSQIQSNDLTDVEWTSSNVTVAQDAAGIDGAANNACTLTATAGNGTVIANAIVAASDTHATCWYLRRVTGTGNIDLTLDNGATWTTVTLTSAFQKFTVDQAALTNPQVGIRIVTSGDAVEVGNAECFLTFTEAKARGLSPIFTSGAADSIAAVDPASFDDANHDDTIGAYYFEWIPSYATSEVSGDLQLLSLNAGADLCYYDGTNGDVESADGTNTATKSQTVANGTTYKVGIVYGNDTLRVNVDGTWGTEVSYDGAFPTGSVLELFNDHGYAGRMRSLQRWTGPSKTALQSKIDELVA